MKHFGTALREAMQNRWMDIQTLADRMGVDRTTVSYYLKCDKEPKTFHKILEGLNCTREEFYGDSSKTACIPVYGNIAAGIPIEAIEDITDYEEVDTDIYRNIKEYFALRLKGVSMLPRMHSGDVVIFHKQPDADNGDIVAVFVGGEDATCKQLIKKDDGIILHALNESFCDMPFTNEQVRTLPIEIIGKAVELRARL